ncbi:hypothetical protein ACXGQW_06830 [Wenyingzhuangia sp. IMCC45533]
MKLHTLYTLILLAVSNIAFSQTNGFSYNAVIRKDSGEALLRGQNISLYIRILKGSIGDTEVYSQTYENYVLRNGGLISVVIGNQPSFASIDWSVDDYFLETSVDTSGGDSFQVVGTSQILSVPYTNHADVTKSVLIKT